MPRTRPYTHVTHTNTPTPSTRRHWLTGEPGGDVFILMRGELVQLDVDLATRLGSVAEGSVFGEGTVLRQLEVRRQAGSSCVCV